MVWHQSGGSWSLQFGNCGLSGLTQVESRCVPCSVVVSMNSFLGIYRPRPWRVHVQMMRGPRERTGPKCFPSVWLLLCPAWEIFFFLFIFTKSLPGLQAMSSWSLATNNLPNDDRRIAKRHAHQQPFRLLPTLRLLLYVNNDFKPNLIFQFK